MRKLDARDQTRSFDFSLSSTSIQVVASGRMALISRRPKAGLKSWAISGPVVSKRLSREDAQCRSLCGSDQ